MTIAIYTAAGKRLDRQGKHLTVEQIRAFPHRGVVQIEPGAEVARVWLLDDDACVSTLRHRLAHDTFDYLLGGVAVLLLAHRPEPIARVRQSLLAATSPHRGETVRHAAADKVTRDIAA